MWVYRQDIPPLERRQRGAKQYHRVSGIRKLKWYTGSSQEIMKEILINIHFDIIQFAYATAIQIKHNRLFCLHFTADVNFHLMKLESKNQNTVGSVK